MEDGFWEALSALGEPTVGVDGFMEYGPEKKRASEVLDEVRRAKQMLVEDNVEDEKVDFDWDCCDDNFESRHFLENLLPSGYSYNVTKLKIDEKSDICPETQFLAKFSVNVCKDEGKEKFLKDLSAKTETSFCPKRKEQVIKPQQGSSYKSNRYNCNRKVRQNPKKGEVKPKQVGKNTECPAFFSYKFFSCEIDHDSDQGCSNLVVILSSDHNHALSTTDSWNFLKVTQETTNRYLELFEAGYTPSKARLAYIQGLKAKLGKKGYFEIAARRSVNPDSTTVFNLWTKYCKRFGSVNGPDSYLKAVDLISKLNERAGETIATIRQLHDAEGTVVVAVVDEVMRRTHELVPQAADVMYVDATGSVDRCNHQVLFVYFYSAHMLS